MRYHIIMKIKTWVLTLTGLLVIVLTVCLVLTSQRHQSNKILVGVDVSWPNCATPPVAADFGVVGVSGGLDFRVNNCLRSEANWFSSPALYMNSGWPGADMTFQYKTFPEKCSVGDETCLAYNYGYHAAVFAINYANSQLTHSTNWWLDIETENSWTNNTYQNRSAILGMVDALRQNVIGVTVGVYAYPGQWATLVGNWHPGLPAWVATGSTNLVAAKAACSAPSITAKPVVLAQYTTYLDQDLMCDQ